MIETVKYTKALRLYIKSNLVNKEKLINTLNEYITTYIKYGQNDRSIIPYAEQTVEVYTEQTVKLYGDNEIDKVVEEFIKAAFEVVRDMRLTGNCKYRKDYDKFVRKLVELYLIQGHTKKIEAVHATIELDKQIARTKSALAEMNEIEVGKIIGNKKQDSNLEEFYDRLRYDINKRFTSANEDYKHLNTLSNGIGKILLDIIHNENSLSNIEVAYENFIIYEKKFNSVRDELKREVRLAPANNVLADTYELITERHTILANLIMDYLAPLIHPDVLLEKSSGALTEIITKGNIRKTLKSITTDKANKFSAGAKNG